MADKSELYKELTVLEVLLVEYCKAGNTVDKKTKANILNRIKEIKDILEI